MSSTGLEFGVVRRRADSDETVEESGAGRRVVLSDAAGERNSVEAAERGGASTIHLDATWSPRGGMASTVARTRVSVPLVSDVQLTESGGVVPTS